jgi:predicted acylesterase/phospholipase RssA
MRRLIAAHIPIDVIVGSSAGAILGACYAAVGMSIDEIIADAPRLHVRHFLAHSLTFRLPERARPWLRRHGGIVPARLEALDRAQFDSLHHGVSGFGVVCHDRRTRRPWYFSTAESYGAPLAGVVKASAAVPVLFPPRSQWADGQELRLTDGGLSDPLPFEFARRPGLDATHLIVSDCLRFALPMPDDERIIRLRPPMRGFGVVPRISFSLDEAIATGESVVTDAVLDRVRDWCR